MLRDSAAAIAARKSGTLSSLSLSDDTNALVDNEAVVVYDERTSL